MILNWLIDAVVGIFQPLIDLLPSGSSLTLPGAASVASFLSKVDYLIPIVGVVQLALGLLVGLIVFFGIRLTIVIWQQLKW